MSDYKSIDLHKYADDILVVIPARYGSTRLPGKPLIEINGKTIIQYVYENILSSGVFKNIVVATDDERIFAAVRKFNGNAAMTPENCASGTDRLAYLINQKNYSGYKIIVNVQGDEPTLEPNAVEEAVKLLIYNKSDVSTLAVRLKDPESIKNPNIVKVVFSKKNNALYFSRSAIPYPRDTEIFPNNYFKHIGVYIYTREVLLKFAALEKSEIEDIEKLEQLRLLDNGYKISVALTIKDTVGVDVIDDIEKVKNYLEKNK